jgi:tetratricopeptide (TPR) repeat protein
MTKIVTCIALLVGTATLAFAQRPPTKPAPSPSSAPDPVKVHFDQGVALYNDGNFSAALAEFEAAYTLNPAPYILNNIGLAQKGLFRYPEAIATLQKYILDSTNISADQLKQTQRVIAEMQALLSPITFDVTPAGAVIAVDGHAIGTAPLPAPVQIAAGSYTLEVTHEGYATARRDLTIAASTPQTVAVGLELVRKLGTLRVTTLPRSTITIDGRPLGTGDIQTELDAGGHTLDVSAPGFLAHREELTLGVGQDRDLTIRLDKMPAWYRHWYVWGPASVVIVGTLTALTIDLTTKQGPIPGSLGLGKAQ